MRSVATVVPASLWASLTGGIDIQLTAPVDYRVNVLIEDYLETPESRAELREQLPFIESRMGKSKWAGELVARLDDGRERELVEILLERYYDPLYGHSEAKHNYGHAVDSSDPSLAAEQIVAWIEARAELAG